jgi:aspartate 1-decarboxylase
MRIMLKSKIHKAIVTQANVDYIGSITIDVSLLEKTGLITGEQVLVADSTNGSRLVTYVIPGKRNSGEICMNGAAAHLIKPGDEIIIMAFEITNKILRAKNILVDKRNRFVKYI